MINYGFLKIINTSLTEAENKISEKLAKEGFGILTRIDLKEKFKEKLNVEFKNYIILGACNPANAYKAILAEENIGLFLPCNIILYEKDNKTIVSIIKPTVAMSMIDNPGLRDMANEVELKLKKVIEKL